MDFCMTFEHGDPAFYVFYIHGWLLPHIAQLRAEGKLEIREINKLDLGDKKKERRAYGRNHLGTV